MKKTVESYVVDFNNGKDIPQRHFSDIKFAEKLLESDNKAYIYLSEDLKRDYKKVKYLVSHFAKDLDLVKRIINDYEELIDEECRNKDVNLAELCLIVSNNNKYVRENAVVEFCKNRVESFMTYLWNLEDDSFENVQKIIGNRPELLKYYLDERVESLLINAQDDLYNAYEEYSELPVDSVLQLYAHLNYSNEEEFENDKVKGFASRLIKAKDESLVKYMKENDVLLSNYFCEMYDFILRYWKDFEENDKLNKRDVFEEKLYDAKYDNGKRKVFEFTIDDVEEFIKKAYDDCDIFDVSYEEINKRRELEFMKAASEDEFITYMDKKIKQEEESEGYEYDEEKLRKVDFTDEKQREEALSDPLVKQVFEYGIYLYEELRKQKVLLKESAILRFDEYRGQSKVRVKED